MLADLIFSGAHCVSTPNFLTGYGIVGNMIQHTVENRHTISMLPWIEREDYSISLIIVAPISAAI